MIVRHDHFAAMMIYATRYCLGRASYAPGEMVDILRAYRGRLDDTTRSVMSGDIRMHIERTPADPCRSDWDAALVLLAPKGKS